MRRKKKHLKCPIIFNQKNKVKTFKDKRFNLTNNKSKKLSDLPYNSFSYDVSYK